VLEKSLWAIWRSEFAQIHECQAPPSRGSDTHLYLHPPPIYSVSQLSLTLVAA